MCRMVSLIVTPPATVFGPARVEIASLVALEDVERERPRPRVDVGDRLVERRVRHHGQDRPEDLLAHHARVRRRAPRTIVGGIRRVRGVRRRLRRRASTTSAPARAPRRGSRQPVEVPRVDDRGVVGWTRSDPGSRPRRRAAPRRRTRRTAPRAPARSRARCTSARRSCSLPTMMRSAAARESGSRGATIAGDLPPSSSVTGVRFSAAARITARPTAVEPVKSRWSNGSAEKAARPSASPVTTATSSGANARAPASRAARPSPARAPTS